LALGRYLESVSKRFDATDAAVSKRFDATDAAVSKRFDATDAALREVKKLLQARRA
jgi:broad specificity phosphatase PhoE